MIATPATCGRNVSSLPAGTYIFAWHDLYRVVKHTGARTYLSAVAGGSLPFASLGIGEMPAGSAERPYFLHGTPAHMTRSGGDLRQFFVVLAATDEAAALAAVASIAAPALRAAAELSRLAAEREAVCRAAEAALSASLAG